MTENLNEASAKLNTLGGASQFLRNDLVSDSLKNLIPMNTIGNFMGNLGQADLASNFILE
jgi:hypothetical protein